MSIPAPLTPVFYPESDGKPMADNTRQFRWIAALAGNLAILFHQRPDVFVGGNLFWYPVENFPDIVQAPDVFVVFDRPQHDRPSYKQWEEDNVPMSVVFEVRSPNDGDALMREKLEFYDEHQVAEYYVFDPDANTLKAYVRRGGNLGPVRLRNKSHTSSRLGIRFDLSGPEMVVYFPNGERFLTMPELKTHQEGETRRANHAEAQRAQAEAQRAHAEAQRAQAEAQRAQAEARAVTAEALLARTLELTRRALAGQASPRELVELQQLQARLSAP